MRLSVSRLAGLAALLVLLLAAGTWTGVPAFVTQHARTAYDTAGLEVQRTGWDTLRVQPRFVRRTSLSAARAAMPSASTVRVFDAGYDTLYAGTADAAIPVPDRRLAGREPMLVEACGTFRSGGSGGAFSAARVVCEQATVRASPKRVRAKEVGITFPEGSDFQRGRYDVRLRVERRAFSDTARWEPLAKSRPRGVLLAQAESEGGQAAVRVPMDSSGRGTFDLARYDGYDDFSYHLRAALERPRRLATTREGAPPPSATVHFEVRAASNGKSSALVRRVQKTVRRKTPAERRRRVQGFAYSAAEALARKLLPEEWDRGARTMDARATVRGWRYDRAGERYEVDLRVRWFEEDAPDDRYALEGTLTVKENSRQARFAGERGNRRAVHRWRRTVESETLSLGTLAEPGEEADLPEVEGEERLRDVAQRRPRGDDGDDH